MKDRYAVTAYTGVIASRGKQCGNYLAGGSTPSSCIQPPILSSILTLGAADSPSSFSLIPTLVAKQRVQQVTEISDRVE